MLDLKFYRAFNQDLSKMTDSQLIHHYSTNGKNENRIYSGKSFLLHFPDFSLNVYKNSNSDLKGMSNFELILHFYYNGRFENRLYQETFNNTNETEILKLLRELKDECQNCFRKMSKSICYCHSNKNDSIDKLESQNQLTTHIAKALVLTCMDFRLLDDLVSYMNKNGYDNNYNQFILAGGSLGYNQNIYDEWKKALDKHIELALELHKIKEIIIIDHMKCSVYKKFYNKIELTDNEELSLHKDNIEKFKIYVIE